LRTSQNLSGDQGQRARIAAAGAFKPRAALHLEDFAPRRQLGIFHRSVKRPKLTSSDRLRGAWLSGIWAGWRSALVIVRPEIVIAWHRNGFRLLWPWKVCHGQLLAIARCPRHSRFIFK
jgi:hypothetical protein